MAHRKLPLPDGGNPGIRSRPPPRPPSDDSSPPPPLPSRRAPPPPPSEQPEPSQEIYDDGDVGEVYDDGTVGEDSPEDFYNDAEAGEVYDDLEGSPPPPPPPQSRRAVPLPQPPPSRTNNHVEDTPKSGMKLPPPPPMEESVYEVEPQISEPVPSKESQGGDIYDSVQDPPEAQSKLQDKKLPPLPPVARIPSQQSQEEEQEEYDEFDIALTEDREPEQEEYDAFEVGEAVQETYEAVDEPAPPRPPPGRGAPAAPPAPPAPSAPAAPPPPSRETKRPPAPRPQKQDPPAPKPQSSSGGLDLNAVLGARKNLRSVGKPPMEKQVSTESDKVYGDSDVQSAFAKFRQKEKEAGQKPPLLQKPNFQIPKPSSLPVDTKPASSPGLKSPSTSKADNMSSKNKTDRTPSPPPPVPSSNRPSNAPHSYTKVSPKSHNGTTQVKVEPEDDDEDIYDDAMSQFDPLLKEPWYFKELDRKDGERRLKNLNENGSFLIRDSSKGGRNQPYTMMVLYNSLIYNLKIRERDDGKVALGEEKSDEMAFIDVKEMVQYHRSNDVILVHNGKQNLTLLKQSPKK